MELFQVAIKGSHFNPLKGKGRVIPLWKRWTDIVFRLLVQDPYSMIVLEIFHMLQPGPCVYFCAEILSESPKVTLHLYGSILP